MKKTSDLVLISIFMYALQMLSMWSIDVSVAAMINNGQVTNGFFTNNPLISYHIGIYILLIASFAQILLIMHISQKEKEKDAYEDK